MKLKMTSLAAVALTLTLVSAASAIQLSQTRLEMRVNKDTSLEVTNNTSDKLAIQVEIAKEEHPGSVAKLPPNFRGCEKALKPFPRFFELVPGQYQNVKFLARESGNCRVYIVSNKVEAPVKPGEQKEGMDLKMPIRTGIPAIVKP